ncbi:MAG: sugar transferase, partial [Planctomycetes bacterium]|nr:sugar transferase [Planctomycetota bacterium]
MEIGIARVWQPAIRPGLRSPRDRQGKRSVNPPPEEALLQERRRATVFTSYQLKKAGWLELKYSLDALFAIALFIVCLPVLALAILAIKLTSRGPVFFKQRRVGENGQLFEILKLRTM